MVLARMCSALLVLAGSELEIWHSDFTSVIYLVIMGILQELSSLGWISAAEGGTSSVKVRRTGSARREQGFQFLPIPVIGGERTTALCSYRSLSKLKAPSTVKHSYVCSNLSASFWPPKLSGEGPWHVS